MAGTFKDWQEMIADPLLTRKFSSEVIITQLGMVISGTHFGPKSDYDALAIATRFFHHQSSNVVAFNDWLGWVAHLAEDASLLLGTGLPTPIFCKSLAFKNDTLIPDHVIDKLFTYCDNVEKGTPLWFAYFDLGGGAVNDVPMGATAYAHRDALFYMQSYAIGLDFGHVSPKTKNFIRGIADIITRGMPSVDFGVYAGYVDPELENAQRKYWGSNLERLEEIKQAVDPEDLFHNPQSVRPARVGFRVQN